MTRVESQRGRCRREVQLASTERGVIELVREGVMIREKGRRTVYGPITYTHIFMIGARMKAEENIKARKLRRASRRKTPHRRKL